LIYDVNMLAWNIQQFYQISDGSLATSFDITDFVKFVAFLLSNVGSMLCSKSVSADLAILGMRM